MTDHEVSFDPSPSPTGVGLTVAFAALVVAVTASRPIGASVAVVGLVAAIAGVRRSTRRLVTAGTLVAFGGVALAGARGASPVATLAGAAGVALAWDVGTNAVSVGRQLGAGAATARIEAGHAVASALFATVVCAVALAAARVARGDPPAPGIVALFVAVLALGWLLDR